MIHADVRTNQYDAADQLTGSSTAPLGGTGPISATAYTYDALGDQIGASGPGGATADTYDMHGRQLRLRRAGRPAARVRAGRGRTDPEQ